MSRYESMSSHSNYHQNRTMHYPPHLMPSYNFRPVPEYDEQTEEEQSNVQASMVQREMSVEDRIPKIVRRRRRNSNDVGSVSQLVDPEDI